MKNTALVGIFWIIISTLMAASADGIIKFLGSEFHPYQLVFFRSFIVLLVLLAPWMLYKKRKTTVGDFRKVSIKKYLLLAICKITSFLSYIISLNYFPLPTIAAIFLLTTPLSMLMATIILKEEFNIYKIIGLFGGILGVLLIIKPGFVELTPYIIIPFAMAVADSFYKITIKSISGRVRMFDVAFYPLIFMSIMTAPLAIIHWKTPDLSEALVILTFAVLISFYLLAMIKAYSHTDLTTLAPFDFMYLLFLSIIAYVFYDELIDVWTALGGLIIVMSGWYIIRKEKGKHILQEIDIGH